MPRRRISAYSVQVNSRSFPLSDMWKVSEEEAETARNGEREDSLALAPESLAYIPLQGYPDPTSFPEPSS